MSKKNKNKSAKHPTASKAPVKSNNAESGTASKLEDKPTLFVRPEHISLLAHTHIKRYLEKSQRPKLNTNDVTAILRLSQHLRVFGLLSAAGYVNQTNEQEGEVRKRTVPVWESLLGQFMEQRQLDKEQLMHDITQLANHEPAEYMARWRKALTLSRHWNFWARAYAEDDKKEKG